MSPKMPIVETSDFLDPSLFRTKILTGVRKINCSTPMDIVKLHYARSYIELYSKPRLINELNCYGIFIILRTWRPKTFRLLQKHKPQGRVAGIVGIMELFDSCQQNKMKFFTVLHLLEFKLFHDDITQWKHFPRYWPFVRGIHRSPVNSPHKGQWRRALMFYLICAWINGWVNNREAGDLRRHRAHCDVTVM